MTLTNSSNFVVRTDVVKAYLKDINAVTLMTKQEEMELFKKYEESVERLECVKADASYFSRDEYNSIVAREESIQEEIRNEIILRNQRFNFAVAKRYDNNEILMDLVNVGTIGMYEAFNEYKLSKGVRFCSFAVWYIRRAINAYLLKENLTIRTTNNTRYLPKVRKIENEFFLKNGRKPCASEVMDILLEKYGIEVASSADLYEVRTNSIDDTCSDEDDFTVEKSSEFAISTASYNSYEETIENESKANYIKNALKVLSEREKTIICMSTGYGYDREYKDAEIGEVVGMSSERVRQLRHSVTKKLAAAYSAAASK